MFRERLHDLWLRLKALVKRRQLDRDLADELEFHLGMREEKLIKQGMSPREARYAARRGFGNVVSVKETSRDMWGFLLLETLLQDVRFGLRTLLKNRGFTSVAVLTLALGIGANTAIFSVINAVLLRPLPYADPDRLVRIWGTESKKGAQRLVLSAPNFLDLQAQLHALEEIAAHRGWQYTITGSGEPVTVYGQRVSSGFFRVLAANPIQGRQFVPEEDIAGKDHVVILSNRLWLSHFGGDRNIVGQTITVNDIPRTVIGIMAPDFEFSSADNDLWVPLALTPPELSRGLGNLYVIGRLRRGASLSTAEAEMNTIASRLEQKYPEANKDKGLRVVRLQEDMIGDVRPALLLLLGAVVFVLLIACANVANLQLNRGVARKREIAIRTAMGASPGRVVRQLLTEGLCISFTAAGSALVLAALGMSALTHLAPLQIPRLQEAHIDGVVFCFTIVISVLTSVLFGLFPSLQASKLDPADSLKEGARTGPSPQGRRAGRVFLVVEVALALILLIGAGLMTKSFLHLVRIDPGFRTDGLLTLEIFLSPTRYSEPERQAAFYQQVLQRIGSIPGVKSVAGSIGAPFTGANIYISVTLVEHPAASSEQYAASYRSITPDYFRTMGIPILTGRDFTEQDHKAAPGVAIVNESFVRRYFGNDNPIGKHLDIGDGFNREREIVGVVGDARSSGLNDVPVPEMYVVYLQRPWQWLDYVVRAGPDPESLTTAVRSAVWGVDKEVPVNNIRTMTELVSHNVSEPKFYLVLLGFFAGLALILAAVGIYGLFSCVVTQRTREIGVRVALGAERGDVLGLVVGEGMLLTLIGVGIGLAGASALTRFLSTLLYGVRSTDSTAFLVAPVILACIAFLACYIPARRATKVDPMVALRYE